MGLSAAQLTALKANIAANSNTVLIGGTPTAISAVPNTGDGNFAIAAWYNLAASPDFNVFRTDVPTADIFDAVTWANYTPQDAIAGDGSNAALWTARSMACQGKQFNLQILLQSRSTFDASKITQRAGLNDATTSLPSGVAGASKSGGWVGILVILRRLAKNIEKLFAVATSGVGTDGIPGNLGLASNPGLMAFEGSINGDDVQNARNS